jgi:hypothetical protein
VASNTAEGPSNLEFEHSTGSWRLGKQRAVTNPWWSDNSLQDWFFDGRGTAFAHNDCMPAGMHSYSKEQREAVRHLLHTVLMRDMGSFDPQRFKEWIKEMDAKFRKVALSLVFNLHNRSVNFTIRELRTGRAAFRFTSSTRVRFDDREVVMSPEEILGAR